MRSFFSCLISFGLILLSVTAQAKESVQASTTLPITYFHDLITVPVFVNDAGPYPFLIDTGATTSVIFRGFAKDYEIEQSGTTTHNVHGINTSEIRPVLTATNFRIGDFNLGTVFPVEAPTWAGADKPKGIIGLDILQSYGVIINSRDKNITIATPDRFEDQLTPSWKSSKLRTNPYDKENPRGLMFVYVDIDANSRIPAIFDTGSQMTMMNKSSANNYFKDHSVSNGQKNWAHRGALTTEYVNKFILVPKLKFGRMRWDKFNILVKDMSSLEIINKRQSPLMIVGMDLMKNRDFAINFPDKRLYVSGPRETKADIASGFSMAVYEAAGG